MRTTTLLTLAALLTAAPLAAQNTAVAVGTVRAEVRITAGMTIPVYLRATETAGFTKTREANGTTEYLATYTVRGNVDWTLDATNTPAGVTVLDLDGNWAATPTTIGMGDPTNGTTITVRVRVAQNAAANWQHALQLEAVQR